MRRMEDLVDIFQSRRLVDTHSTKVLSQEDPGMAMERMDREMDKMAKWEGFHRVFSLGEGV